MAIINNKKLEFIKKRFNTIEAAKQAAVAGKIIFDSNHKIIFEDGQAYGGNIVDATFTSSILTITKAEGDPVIVDFSDVASASAMMNVFTQLGDIIGLSGSGSGIGIDYSNTNYLQDAESLVDADKVLDAKIKELEDEIGSLDGEAVVATVNNGIVTIKKKIVETDGVIGNETGSQSGIDLAKVATTGAAGDVAFTPYTPQSLGSGNGISATNVQDAIEDVVDKIIENEQVVEETFEAIKDATGLNSNFEYTPDPNDHYINNADNITEALDLLDAAVAGVSGSFDVIKSTQTNNTPAGVEWIDEEQTPAVTVTGSLVASADTFHKIYLVPVASTGTNKYAEYITAKDTIGQTITYSWERLGTIDVDLTGYVKSITVNGKTYTVPSGTNINLGDVVTSVTGETAISGGNSNFVAVTATPTTDSTNGTKTVAIGSTVKTKTLETATGSDDGLATAKNVKDYIDNKDLYWDEWESGSGSDE